MASASTFGDISCCRNGEPVAIKPKALDTLLVLVEQRGQVVSKDELMSRLWPDTAVEEANLTQNIFVVRKALGEVPGEQRFIATVARHGYRFVAEVAEERAADARPGITDAMPTDGHRRRSWRLIALTAISLAGALIVAMVLWDRQQASSTATPIRAMAVLPFRNLSADPEQAYFVDGMTEAVITDLASISALRVVSHQSVRRYRDSAQPLADIARELGVDAIVEGSVGRTGNRIRLTAQLIEARSDQHLWAASYDRELGDVLTLQGQLARAVAGAVRVIVSEPERAALAARRTVDPLKVTYLMPSRRSVYATWRAPSVEGLRRLALRRRFRVVERHHENGRWQDGRSESTPEIPRDASTHGLAPSGKDGKSLLAKVLVEGECALHPDLSHDLEAHAVDEAQVSSLRGQERGSPRAVKELVNPHEAENRHDVHVQRSARHKAEPRLDESRCLHEHVVRGHEVFVPLDELAPDPLRASVLYVVGVENSEHGARVHERAHRPNTSARWRS